MLTVEINFLTVGTNKFCCLLGRGALWIFFLIYWLTGRNSLP